MSGEAGSSGYHLLDEVGEQGCEYSWARPMGGAMLGQVDRVDPVNGASKLTQGELR